MTEKVEKRRKYLHGLGLATLSLAIVLFQPLVRLGAAEVDVVRIGR